MGRRICSPVAHSPHSVRWALWLSAGAAGWVVDGCRLLEDCRGLKRYGGELSLCEGTVYPRIGGAVGDLWAL